MPSIAEKQTRYPTAAWTCNLRGSEVLNEVICTCVGQYHGSSLRRAGTYILPVERQTE